MKKITLLLFAGILLVLNCKGQDKEERSKQFIAAHKADIDFNIGSSPKYFSAKTIDGSIFNSEVNKGKYWVIFVYQIDDLKNSENYDMVAELNETYQRFGNKFQMIGIAEGFSENEQETQKLFKESKLRFKQIDNTEGVNKEIKLKENVVCTPAKILIGPDGKVILNGCGGKTKSLDDELERLIKQNKQ
ncbi:TlpA family protein disulfide reductase [Chryseobacterium lineare]